MTSATFTREDITTVSRNNDASLADVDGDQDLDVVVASFEDNSISWHENDGHGAFSAAQMIDPTAGPAYRLLVNDLDRDGDSDLTVSVNNELHWYENLDGQGRFALPQTVYVAGGNIWQIASVNLDGDADEDLIAVSSPENTSNQLTVLENVGNGVLVQGQSFTVPSTTGAISVSDVDNDGDQDVLFPDATFGDVIVSKVLWLENTDARGAFSDTKLFSELPPGYFPWLLVTDLDSDGKKDFLTQQQSGQFAWSERTPGANPLGSLYPLGISAPIGPVVATADVNSDGILDLFFATDFQNLRWLPSRTNTEVPYDTAKDVAQDSATKILVGDLDGDKRDDLITIDSISIQSYHYIPLEDRFERQDIAPRSQVIVDVRVVDVDGDGWKDLVTSEAPDILGISIQYRRNLQGTGSYGDAVELSAVELESMNDFELADLDGDGRQDLLLAYGRNLIWQRQASDAVTFGSPRSLLTDQPVSQLESVDLDKDSDMDLVVLTNNGLMWLENTGGQGTFQSHTISTLPSSSTTFLTVGDLDGDSNLDIVVPSDSVGIQWFQHRDGKGNFRARGAVGDLLGNTNFLQVELHDMNGDGRLDLTGRSDNGSTFGWLENSATGFKPFRTIDVVLDKVYQGHNPAITDFDGDHDLDLLIALRDNSSAMYDLVLYENQGNGQLQRSARDLGSIGRLDFATYHLVAEKLNADEPSDLVLIGRGTLSVLTARTAGDVNGDLVFDSADLLAAFQAGEYEDPFVGNSDFFEGDWNGDGEFDTNDIILAWQFGHYRS